MTDITKLKQEAEEARSLAVDEIRNIPHIGLVYAGRVADAIILATIRQIALQAAEKEAEARKYEPCFECNRSHPHENMNYECLRKTVEARLAANPAPIADDGWIKWEGGECPVNRDCKVEIRIRAGDFFLALAKRWHWEHRGDEQDIIAYRIIQPAADRVGEP